MRYWFRLKNEIKTWKIIYSTTKQYKKFLEDNGLRVDRLGRMYTVINVPPEITDIHAESFVLGQLRKYDEIMIRLRLVDIVYPSIQKIDEPDSNAYLLILEGSRRYLNFWSIFKNLFFTVGLVVFFYFTINYLIDTNILQKFNDFIR